MTIELNKSAARSSPSSADLSGAASKPSYRRRQHQQRNNQHRNRHRQREPFERPKQQQRESHSAGEEQQRQDACSINDQLKHNDKEGAERDADQADKIPGAQLERLTKEILDQTKQLGFFDEVRMLLLDQIESSKEFRRVREEFSREVERFCSRADLSLDRPKLRNQLQAEIFADEQSELNSRLNESIDRITYKYTQEKLRPLFDEHAAKFLEQKQYVIDTQSSGSSGHTLGDDTRRARDCGKNITTATTASGTTGDLELDREPEPEPDRPSSRSCSSSQADSGFTSTPPSSCTNLQDSTSTSPQTVDRAESTSSGGARRPTLREEDEFVMSTAEAVAAILSNSLPADTAKEEAAAAAAAEEEEEEEEPLGKMGLKYARRRQRRIKRKENRRRLRAQLSGDSTASLCGSNLS